MSEQEAKPEEVKPPSDRVACKPGMEHKWSEHILPLISPDGSSVPHIKCRHTMCDNCGVGAVINGVTGAIEAPHKMIMGVRK